MFPRRLQPNSTPRPQIELLFDLKSHSYSSRAFYSYFEVSLRFHLHSNADHAHVRVVYIRRPVRPFASNLRWNGAWGRAYTRIGVSGTPVRVCPHSRADVIDLRLDFSGIYCGRRRWKNAIYPTFVLPPPSQNKT